MQTNRNYYQDLFIQKDATQAEIAQAYRKLSLQYHPKLSKSTINESYANFCRVSEAYEVLSDRKKRDFYDIHGEYKLKEGFFLDKQLKGGYSFQGNPSEIFESFFGKENPFAQIYDYDGVQPIGSLLGFEFDAENYFGIDLPRDLHVEVPCTLSELYNGCFKNVTYKRTLLNGDGKTTREVQETKYIEIKKGYQNGYPIVFKELGNQQSGVKSSDLIFDIKQVRSDNRFKRQGHDLIYTANISLSDALQSKPVEIQTLDARTIYVPVDEVISPQTIKVQEGEGMPIYNPDEFLVENFNKPLEKGNLLIKFNIQFPQHIEEEKKQELIEILEQCYPQDD